MTRAVEPVAPPATVGVLGGGQLGRYAVMAARTMGYRTVVLEPDPGAPAGAVADVHLVAPYDDDDALGRLAAECAVVTTEFENPPAEALRRLAEAVPVRPGADAIAVAQDRRAEKRFLAALGVPLAPFAVVDSEADVAELAASGGVGWPAILKTARLGYDGKGQVTVGSAGALAGAWSALGGVPCVLEAQLPLDAPGALELSVVLARGAGGEVAAHPPTRNVHVGGILDLSVVGDVDEHAERATTLAEAVAVELAYVGVLAVEMFLVDGELLVNELAPRPHNSGHWTLDAAATDQFEQQVRAVCGLGLGDAGRTSPAAAMVNLLGDEWRDGTPDWSRVLAHPAAHLHLYGKAAARPGRKMGHITVTAASPGEAAAAALACRAHARVGSQLDR